MDFQDLLYGRFSLPDWIKPFLRLPEFVRLRGIRLSNVDSVEFKDFGSATRWEHGVATAFLATRVAKQRELSLSQTAQLTLAALLHDVATPPFAHTAESVLDGFDHELTSQMLLAQRNAEDVLANVAVFHSAGPRFQLECAALAKKLRISVDPDEIARMIVGQGDAGFFISGTLDLDNADNVIRGCALLGLDVDRQLPLRIADWLATQDDAPTPLSEIHEPCVVEWLHWRNVYYEHFYSSGPDESGREAFLRHLMRRALKEGLPRRVLVWNTDDGLLTAMAEVGRNSESNRQPALSDLVDRYRLLETPALYGRIAIESEDAFRGIATPEAASWIEDELAEQGIESCVMPVKRRFGARVDDLSLFGPSAGHIAVYRLGSAVLKRGKSRHEENGSKKPSMKPNPAMASQLQDQVLQWSRERPWLRITPQRRENLRQSLDAFGDWSFRTARNESIHAYPSTFVHAIPAALIAGLGLRGETILDPFGGTGQTAAEVLRSGGEAITADASSVATLVARARFLYLSPSTRNKLALIQKDAIKDLDPAASPEFALKQKWHHKQTAVELRQILAFVRSRRDERVRCFLEACFSAILPSTTGRKGKEHGFFADNTPLPASLTTPPYQDAISLFVAKVRRNLMISQRFYGQLERAGYDPEQHLERNVKVLQQEIRTATSTSYDVPAGSVSAIITSPPYLCMADYTLGQRLTYYWLFPELMDRDFANELGARRRRGGKTDTVVEAYFEGIKQFAGVANKVLALGGYVATILGAPVADSFKNIKVFKTFDAVMEEAGFQLVWDTTRSIQWHRNQGYQRLRKERISVHIRK